MSGLSFSTQWSPTLTGVRAPTERHLAHAKRKLYQFVLREIDRVGQSSYRSDIESSSDGHDSLLHFLALPLDIMIRVMYVMEPTVLASFGGTCKLFYFASRQPKLWIAHNQRILKDLDLSGIHLGITELGSKEIFAALYRHFNTLTRVVSLLKSMKDSDTVEEDRRQVEELFHSRLRIRSPWCLSVNDRVEKELAHLPSVPTRQWHLYGNVVGLQLNITDGFYAGECLHFHIFLSESYPHTPPLVRSLSASLYHPLISEDGDVNLNILIANNWNTHTYDLRDVVLAIENLFLDQTLLTSDFTL